jgi:hypothetical protein
MQISASGLKLSADLMQISTLYVRLTAPHLFCRVLWLL